MNTKQAIRALLVLTTLAVCQDLSTIERAVTSRSALAADNSQEVVLYATSWCGYCRKAREYLNSNGIPYTEYDIEKSSEGKRRFAELGGKGVPLILVGNQQIRGWNPAALISALARARVTPSPPAPPARAAGKRAPPPPPVDDGDPGMSYVSIIAPSSDSELRYTIHLRDQRTISVKEYWEEGDQIKYEKFGGVIGLERNDVVKIDDTADGTTKRYE